MNLCSSCKALCCKLEVLLVDDSDDQVPTAFTEKDECGRTVMSRLEDGWCAALDRKTMLCTIYSQRPYLCREYQAGDLDCLDEREKLTSIH